MIGATKPKAWSVDDLDIDAYHGDKTHDSNSTLKLFRKSPAEYHEVRVLGRMAEVQSEPQRLGTLDHITIHEPHRSDELVRIIPEDVLASNGARSTKAWKAWAEENAGLLHVRQQEVDASRRLGDKVRSNPAIRGFLDRATIFEQSIFWESGPHKLKCRVDIGVELDAQIIDVKRTADIGDFIRAVERYGYECQAALYCDGYEALYGVRPEFWFLLVGDNGCDCCIRRLPEALIDVGRDINERTLAELAECRAGLRPWMKTDFDKALDLEVPPRLLPKEPVSTGARDEY